MPARDIVEVSIEESSLSRIQRHMEAHDVAMITGWRNKLINAVDAEDDHRQLTRADKDARNKSLMSALLQLRYGITPVDGKYIEGFGSPDAFETGENSFFVVNLPDDPAFAQNLEKLGRHFGQDSILLKPRGGEAYLLGTNRASFPGLSQKKAFPRFTAGKVPGDAFSRVRGRPFGFVETKEDYGNSAKSLIQAEARPVLRASGIIL